MPPPDSAVWVIGWSTPALSVRVPGPNVTVEDPIDGPNTSEGPVCCRRGGRLSRAPEVRVGEVWMPSGYRRCSVIADGRNAAVMKRGRQ